MQKRRALLVGIEEYGAGFAPLRAVRQDVALMGKALGSCGYEVEEVHDDQHAEALGWMPHISRRFAEFEDLSYSFAEDALASMLHDGSRS
jgi:caspase domain-containing protein